MPRSGTTTDRGYGAEHRAQREHWARRVEAGQVDCHAVRCLMPTRRIYRGQAWDLGHDEASGEWRGPEHARCNRSEGAARGNRTRGQVAVRWRGHVSLDATDL